MSSRQFWLFVLIMVVAQSVSLLVLHSYVSGTERTEKERMTLFLDALIESRDVVLSQQRTEHPMGHLTKVTTLTAEEIKTIIQQTIAEEIGANSNVKEKHDQTELVNNTNQALQKTEQLRLSQQNYEARRVSAYEQSSSIVERAIELGGWREGDRQALQPHLPYLSDQQRIDLIERYMTAVDQNEIQLDGPPPAF